MPWSCVAKWAHVELGAHCPAGFSVDASQGLEALTMGFLISEWGQKP